MPIYEYKCEKCGTIFELKLKVKDLKEAEKKYKCPKCGSSQIKKLISKVGGVYIK